MRSKIPELGSQLGLIHFNLVINQVQDNMGLTNMSDPKYLNLTINLIQDTVGLTNVLDPGT